MDNYACGRVHHLLKSTGNTREIHHIHTKLKLATGTYTLQTNRALFNQKKVDPKYMLCKNSKESLQHFLLDCSVLASIRNPIMNSILEACSSLCNPACNIDTLLKLVIDCSALIDYNIHNHELSNVKFHTRILCFARL